MGVAMGTAMTIRAAWVLLMCLVAVPTVLAQAPMALHGAAATGSDSSDISEALQTLEAGGNTVFVIPSTTDDATQAATPSAPTIKERITAVRKALGPMFAASAGLPGQVVSALREAGEGSLVWFWRALAVGALGAGVGVAAWFVVRRLISRGLAAARDPDVAEERTKRLARALSRLTAGIIAAAAFLGAGILAVLIAVPDRTPEQVTAISIVASVAIFLAARTALRTLFAPDEAAARLVPFDTALAGRLYSQLYWVLLIANVSAGTCFWLADFPLAHDAHQFMLLVAVTLMMGLMALVFIGNRTAITAGIRQGRSTRLRRVTAVLWLPITLLYLFASWILNVAIIALSVTFLVLPTLAPLIASAIGLYVTGTLVLLYNRHFRIEKEPTPRSRLFHNVSAGVGALAALICLAQFFPLAFYSGVETPVVGIIGVVVLGLWFLWRSIEIWVAERLEVEEPTEGGDHDEGMGAGTTRLATLLPILRNCAMFLIAAVGLMVVLASLGVNVAPLFAGAGVVGLAIGFGAQTLIRDMFSGAFFLFDDAFRRGEFIDVGGTVGAVERISVRSFQLRHPEGALHTIPFGEITQLTNYSRDWVVMKLPMRLTYDTDVEKVRKLVKKLGQEMLQDPEIGPLFVEPLKSQGVIQMEDSAMIVRVKFKTTPGNQFVLRRHVYHAIRALFEREGIHFAHREVTVRVAGGETDEETKRQAVLAAAREVVDKEEPKAASPASALG